MGITILWDNEEKTIIRYVYEGRWVWDDLHHARVQVHEMLNTVNHPVGIIVDVRESTLVPNGALSQGRQFATTSPTTHPNEGRTIIVGANTFLRSMYDLFRKIYTTLSGNLDVDFAPTLESARQNLAQDPASARKRTR